MMTSEPVQCPQCQGLLAVMPGRKYCQCAYCGSKFLVSLPDGRTPRLTHLEAVADTPAGQTLLRSAQDRLVDLEMTLAGAEDDLATTRAELDDATSAYHQARAGLQAAVAPLQNMTYVLGLLAALAAFLTLFVFKSPERLPGAAIAVLLALTSVAWHSEWQETEGLRWSLCQTARGALDDAEVELRVAQARLEDGVVERDLLQQQILPALAPVQASNGAEGAA